MTRSLLSLLLILPLFLATSCIKGHEEIWINLDASGHLAARYELPSVALGQIGDPDKIINALNLIAAKEEGVDITKCSCEGKGSKVIFRLEAKFEDVLELFDIAGRNEALFVEETGADPDKIAGVAGLINFRLEGLRPTLDREIQPAEIFPAIVAKRPGMLGSSTFNYVIHLPAEVRQTNAHAISEDGKTVSWTFRVRDYFDKPMVMSLDTKIPFPWWAWILLALFVLLALIVLWLVWHFVIRRFLLKSRHRSLAEQVDLSAS